MDLSIEEIKRGLDYRARSAMQRVAVADTWEREFNRALIAYIEALERRVADLESERLPRLVAP